MNKNTQVITKDIYPMIAKSMDKNSNAFRKCVGNFITSRYNELYDNAPYHRILFGKKEYDEFWSAIKIREDEVIEKLQNAFFWDIPYNPPQIKEAFTVALLCIIRYYLKKNDQKNSELAAVYLAFSGKFYASVHTMSFRKFVPNEYRAIMEYVVNYKLTYKFDLRKNGNMFDTIRSLCITWLNTYKGIMKSNDFDDQDCSDVIQQLRDREKSFMKNVADLYFKAYDNKEYLNYESDNLSDGDSYRLADNDALKAEKYTEMAMNSIVSTTVDYKFCTMMADQNIKKDEIKSIIESIISNNDNLDDLKTIINILISDYMKNNKGKPINGLDFVTYSIRTKPNSKDKNILKIKTIILGWLDENSAQYRKRKNRQATAISYFKAILGYIVLVINKVSR